MVIALPGAQVLFSHIQEVLLHVKGKRVTLTKTIHQALEDSRWQAQEMENIDENYTFYITTK